MPRRALLMVGRLGHRGSRRYRACEEKVRCHGGPKKVLTGYFPTKVVLPKSCQVQKPAECEHLPVPFAIDFTLINFDHFLCITGTEYVAAGKQQKPRGTFNSISEPALGRSERRTRICVGGVLYHLKYVTPPQTKKTRKEKRCGFFSSMSTPPPPPQKKRKKERTEQIRPLSTLHAL